MELQEKRSEVSALHLVLRAIAAVKIIIQGRESINSTTIALKVDGHESERVYMNACRKMKWKLLQSHRFDMSFPAIILQVYTLSSKWVYMVQVLSFTLLFNITREGSQWGITRYTLSPEIHLSPERQVRPNNWFFSYTEDTDLIPGGRERQKSPAAELPWPKGRTPHVQTIRSRALHRDAELCHTVWLQTNTGQGAQQQSRSLAPLGHYLSSDQILSLCWDLHGKILSHSI